MLRFVRSWSAISRSLPQFAPARRPHARRRFTLERLEERAMLSTITLTVNTLADDPGGSVTGQTTLRDAITQADNGTGNQYVIKLAIKGTIDLTSALPDLNDHIVIKGPGASYLTVQRDSSAPDFSVFTMGGNATVSIFGVTIAGGSTITYGGGLWNAAGTLTISDSVITNNFSVMGGGGLWNDTGTLTISDSVFSNNSVGNSAFSGNGGGLWNDTGTLTVSGSVFSDNSANYLGGGLYNDVGTVKVSHCFFADNSAAYDGGGIYDDVGTVKVSDSAFTRNSAEAGVGIYAGGTLTVSDSAFISAVYP